MVPGDVVGGRYQLEAIAGIGGMGTVFRACDQVSGDTVAVKVLFEAHVLSDARFEREAQLLADLKHPGLVRYVAHGMAPSGERYLVMEWLDGEDLARRLSRSRLSIEESVQLALRVGEVLGVVHQESVVHRDLKPSNIFLVGGSIEQVKLLDFGVARFGSHGATTQTGTVLGTPGYMAPEQARSGHTIDARADVFALGCVIFEALTGAAAFAGAHLMATLAKILFEEAPRVAQLRPEVHAALDALVARMLSKNPDDRPHDGHAVVRAIAELGAMAPLPSDSHTPRSSVSRVLTGGEQRLLVVIVVGGGGGGPEAAAIDRQLREVVEARGGHFERLADGSAMVTISGATRIAADQAAQGARCALALRALAPSRPMALATGRAEVTGRLPVGDAVDRAAHLLASRKPILTPAPPSSPPASIPPMSIPSALLAELPPIAVDDVTAGLLDSRFELVRGPNGFELLREHEAMEGTRTLLGTLTAFVGRDREISSLYAQFSECVEAPRAHAVLITAPAGAGKSRLLAEALRVVRQRHLDVEVWVGRGDSLRVGSAFGLLGQALLRALGVAQGEDLETRRAQIRDRVAHHVPYVDQRRVAEFLGEIVGTPFPDDESVPLRAARQDALLMGDQMRRAFEDLVRAECEAHPVLLVLDDLHWGDLPTVRFVDGALRALKGSPLMVMALARPEVHELFPRLWVERGVEEMRLKELTPRASEKLVRQVLGTRVDAATVARVVAQADGHPFFLEELIRAVAEGHTTLPETVLATVSARLLGLEVEARRVLRAASVFGEIFWPDGVIALLGAGERAPRTRQWLTTLVEREVLVRRPDSRVPGEPEFAFRHALLREAAYAMLTESDRRLGHKLAGEWLEKHGEADPMVLAEHFERAGKPERAGGFHLHAAQSAHRGGDTEATIKRARRALECEVAGDVRLSVLGLLCEAHGWAREWAKAEPYAEEVMRMARPGSGPWAQVAPVKMIVDLSMARIDEFMGTLELLQTVDPEPGAAGAVAWGLSAGAFFLDSVGRFTLSEPVLIRMEEVVQPLGDRDPVSRAWLDGSLAFRHAWADEAPFHGLARARASFAGFQEAGHGRGAAIAQVGIGMNLWFLGALQEALSELRATLVANDEVLGLVAPARAVSLVLALADHGALDEAQQEASRIITLAALQSLPADEGRGRWLLAEVRRRAGDLETAHREAQAALGLLSASPLDQAAAGATLAAILLARGRSAEALDAADGAIQRYEAMDAFGYRGAFTRLVHAEALEAAGRRAAARSALAAARARLVVRAAAIGDEALRRSFLEVVPENARTLALARKLFGDL